MYSSWAVLGEVYELTELKLSIRRVISNILEKEWQQKANFVPEKIKFHFDIRLVDLLIEPLYGNSASYGIRELIQNATDACKTRQALYREENYKPEVNIIIENRKEEGKTRKYLRIIDNGIGMSLDVIKNHFLNIGSKFRDSNEWKNLKEEKPGANEPIEKNGKFGVGILSSYLLGDVLKVRTCNVSEKVGYDFETERDTQIIEINKKLQNDCYGTTIEIELKDEIDIESLVLGEWYISNDVSLNIEILGEKRIRQKLINLSEKKEGGIWEKLDLVNSNLEVYWSYGYKIPVMDLQGKNDKSVTSYKPNLVCNGIVIPKKYDEKNRNSIISLWPTVYVIDRKGELELNLSRDEVNGNLPFIKELEAVLLQNFMQEYREIGQQNKFFVSNKMVSSQFNVENYYNQKIMFGKKGYVLFNLFFMEKLMKELSINKIMQNDFCEFNDFLSEREIKVVRIWTNKNISITQDKMLDDNTYYIFEGIGSHPSLKYRITNYLKDVPFNKATIYMQNQQIKDYQEYAANTHRLSQKFIESSKIKGFEESKNFVKEVLKLDVKQEDVVLVIVYSSDNISKESDGSEIFGTYYEDGENVLQAYPEIEL